MRDTLFAPGRRTSIVRALAAAALFLGWTDLARGGVTAAPVLIVLAYVVLVPLVILTWR